MHLPDELRELARRAAAGRRLSKSERSEVERELASHFEAGLERGLTATRLALEFGDAGLAATLISRARVRCRPLAQRVLLATMQVTAAAALMLYLLSTARLQAGSPYRAPDAEQSILPSLLSSHGAAARGGGERTLQPVHAAYQDLFDRIYTRESGRLTAAGLRMIQRLKGKGEPGTIALVLEPLYFALPAGRRETERELEEILSPAARALETDGPGAAAEALRRELRSRLESARWQFRYYPMVVFMPEVLSWLEAGEAVASTR